MWGYFYFETVAVSIPTVRLFGQSNRDGAWSERRPPLSLYNRSLRGRVTYESAKSRPRLHPRLAAPRLRRTRNGRGGPGKHRVDEEERLARCRQAYDYAVEKIRYV